MKSEQCYKIANHLIKAVATTIITLGLAGIVMQHSPSTFEAIVDVQKCRVEMKCEFTSEQQ